MKIRGPGHRLSAPWRELPSNRLQLGQIPQMATAGDSRTAERRHGAMAIEIPSGYVKIAIENGH